MQASRMPNRVSSSPLFGFSPTSQPIDVMATSSRAVISEGPNLRPTLARAGPVKVRMTMPTNPPMNDEKLDTNSAWPGRFFVVAIG